MNPTNAKNKPDIAPPVQPATEKIAAPQPATHQIASPRSTVTRQLLDYAAADLQKAKNRVEELSAAIRVEEQRRSDLKQQRAAAVDAMEAALQAHDAAVRNHQASQAVPAE